MFNAAENGVTLLTHTKEMKMTATTIATQIAALKAQQKVELAAVRQDKIDFAKFERAMQAEFLRADRAEAREVKQTALKQATVARHVAIAECRVLLKGLGLKRGEFEAALV